MRFFIRKKRQPPAVIIVALIDVLIIVLIFLLVTTTFKKPVNALNLTLPESSQAMQVGAAENPPLIVSVEENGGLRIGDDARPVAAEQLKAELAAAIAKNPQLGVSIRADNKAPVGRIVNVMDATKEAGIKNVKLLVKEALPAR